jgi:hypothetical protein
MITSEYRKIGAKDKVAPRIRLRQEQGQERCPKLKKSLKKK